MGCKILFVFAGTGATAEAMRHNNEYDFDAYNNDVVRIYFSGCQDSAIGGRMALFGVLNPNIDGFALKLRQCFDEKGQLSLSKLKKQFGDAVIIKGTAAQEIQVDEINLYGMSRGGVTTFAAARYLDDLNIPVALCAIDPVPGESTEDVKKQSSLYKKNHDLRACKNLKHAEIVLGAYEKDRSIAEESYFKQMVPVFNEACDSSVDIVPRTHHWEDSYMEDAHEGAFFVRQGLLRREFSYKEEEDTMFFLPKILQQQVHTSVLDGTQLSKRYKTRLLNKVQAIPGLEHETSQGLVKVGQALYVLNLLPDFPSKSELIQKVGHDTTGQGKILREFIVEFQNIINYASKKVTNKEIRQFQSDVYQLIANHSIENSSYQQRKDLHNAMIQRLLKLKDQIPAEQYSKLAKQLHIFLNDNALFHPELAKYIDETECYQSKPFQPTQFVVDLKDISTAEELALRLYHMPTKLVESAYREFSANLPKLIKSTGQLVDVLRFLPGVQVSSALNMFKKNEISSMIKTVDDINLVMSQLVTDEQRKVFFDHVMGDIKEMNPTVEQLTVLMGYLSFSKNKKLLQNLPFESINANSSQDMIALLKQFNKEELSELMPLLSTQLKTYVTKLPETDNRLVLFEFLKNNVKGEGAIYSVVTIFKQPVRATNQMDIKSKWTEICPQVDSEPKFEPSQPKGVKTSGL
jgi:hypothetical protein